MKISLPKILILSLFLVATVVPFVLVALGAMSSDAALSRLDFGQASPAQFVDNISEVLWGPSNFAAALGNSLLLCVVMVVIQVPSTLIAAYAFAFFSFPGKRGLYVTLLAAYLIPAVTTVIPLFFVMTALGMKGTPLGILLPYVLFSPYALVLFRERFETLPRELLDQARVDGLGPWGVLWFVAAPAMKSFITLISLVTFVTMWNAFLWPRLIAGSDWPTATVAMSSLQGQYDSNWHLVLSAAFLALIPALSAFVIVRNNLVTTFVEETDN
ncbi:multiple sugar transport system permease protein [Aurantimicrobium minutum]|uniref:carbohydrate ABC transporter permease n=1 Tax=Aurantimicrobium minutum TaxID=708131 RepID=UPI0024745A26|nr:carbohydrate ABC transporter permease [Aurantimicrobium minutum]MDH6532584.1 multiple sugar transport system permease protein [Aurantimicrobium minutum]